MPRHGEVSVRTDAYCREHGDDYYMYAEDHPGDAAYLVRRNPDPQPSVSWTWASGTYDHETYAPTTTASTAAPTTSWWDLLTEIDEADLFDEADL
jgi:hypothetical protein